MGSLSKLTSAVKTLFGSIANLAAATSRVVLRKRKFDPQSLAATFAIGFLRHPNASDEQLAQTAADLGVCVSPQAVEQRYHPRMIAFLRQLFEQAVQLQVPGNKILAPILNRFSDVLVLDSTTIALPVEMANEFPGCGGSHRGEAAVKVQVRMSLKSGCLDAVRLEAGRDCDQKTPLQNDPARPGSLRIADLGYFDTAALTQIEQASAYWLSPLQTGVNVADTEGRPVDLIPWLEEQGPMIDQMVQITNNQHCCRLIAWRVPPAVAARRRQKLHDQARDKGRTPSKQRLERCDWAILITNLPPEKLTREEARALYKTRWQIELLFKRWKSQGKVDDMRDSKWVRAMVKLWSRLLAVVLQQWFSSPLWGRPELSLKKIWDKIQRLAMTLASWWLTARGIRQIVDLLERSAERGMRRNKREYPGTMELLNNPELAAYESEKRTRPVAA